MTAAAWLVPLIAPLAAAAAVLWPGRDRSWLLPLAPLPALALALAGAPFPPPELGWVLLDLRLGLDGLGRVLLALTAFLWAAAGAYARDLAARHRAFGSLLLLTATGNIGLILAADVIGFYALFSLMTVAAYGLVVHERTPFALRAGRVYIAMAIVGEALLLAGFLLAVAEADALDLAAAASAVGDAPHRSLVVGLLVAGLGIKAGVVPLHLWLPLAHPAAPVAASAVLSGAMIKAGLVGVLRVLPLGEVAMPGWATGLVIVGLASAVIGVALGVTQHDAKVVLAYSSVSQMGLIAVLVGLAASGATASGPAAAAATAYALHHGLAKAALFLGTPIAMAESDPRRHRLVLAGMALPALALAGFPLTSGGLAKAWMKDAVDQLGDPWAGPVTVALSLAAVATTVLMGRLLVLLARPPAEGAAQRRHVVPWLAVLGSVALATWLLPASLLVDLAVPSPTPATVWDGLWPVALGAAVVAGVWWFTRERVRPVRAVPAGDLVVVVEAAATQVARGWRATAWIRLFATGAVHAAREAVVSAAAPGAALDRFDTWLTRWRTAGFMFGVVAVALLIAVAIAHR